MIGHSGQGREIVAYRIGDGAIKVVLVGDIHGEYEANTYELSKQLLAHFQAHPEEVPQGISLWILPTMNPDGLANATRWNANKVDLNRNADTDLDGCAGNDWSPDTVGLEGAYPGAGGAHPFSEPEARAVRDFLDDARIAVFYHSAAGAIYSDTCQRHLPSARLAQVLSEGTGYPVPAEGWTGYRITGEFGDYLSGQGVAAATVELTDHEDPEFERNLAGARSLLDGVGEILDAEALDAGAEPVWLETAEGGNTGVWRYAQGSFVHPIALEVIDRTAYLLDAGRILALDLAEALPPRVLLAPAQNVEQVRVLEPLDLAADGGSLLVLDRAGDVYRYEPRRDSWSVERYDRPPGDLYDHYFVAVSAGPQANYLLETTHEQVWRFAEGQRGSAWAKLAQNRDIDLSASESGTYVLARALNTPVGSLVRYPSSGRAQPVSGLAPGVTIMEPRQVLAREKAVYILDRAGRRLLVLEPDTGAARQLAQFIDRRAVDAIWADPSGATFMLAGQDSLYFYGEPDRRATIEGGPTLEGPQPHDLARLEGLADLNMPIEGASLTSRDFQMPGAPRHYRLGVHEGMDFYGHTVGVTINRSTPVRAVAAGTVIRALVDYRPLTAAQADAWQAMSRQLGYTPPDVLDGYRGRQIWIDHGDGLVSRYAHLSSIAPGIVEGTQVTKGQVIARVGNSGTPGSVNTETYDVHLHLELWIDQHFVGQFLRPIEAREWLERILR
ncbi:MAG: peptidoglycan DD-metalloendopeptidase family protein [Anaerolineae bacterium]|nr:peptidoglycan DD-metalloendopeptidase family protein [Anaerolineae bacterium]